MGKSSLLGRVLLPLLALCSNAVSAPLDISLTDLEATHQRYLALEDGWHFNSGDRPEWASPDFDDSSWQESDTFIEPGDLPTDPWVGIGWFRLELTVDESLAGQPLAFYIHQLGASEVYLNGEFVAAIGTVGGTAEAEVAYHETDLTSRPIRFPAGDNLLAVRCSDHNLEDLMRFSGAYGFRIGLGHAERAFSSDEAAIRAYSRRGAIFTAVPATLALLHLLLFLFYPQARSNLYYTLLTASLALLTHQVFAHHFAHDRGDLAVRSTLLGLFIVATSVASLRFLYSLFYPRLPRQFYVALVAGFIVAISFWFISIRLVHVFSLVCLAETFRVVVVAVLRRRDGAKIIGVGFFLFIVACSYQLLGALRVVPLIVDPVYQYGMVAMLATMSLHLARQIAGVNRGLEQANVRLTDYSHTLESRVVERTRELSEQNAKLEEVLAELRRTQNQMVLQEKMASLGSLVAGIAHEINTPMGAINSMYDTMSRALAKLRDHEQLEGDATVEATFDVIDEANRVIADGTRRVADLVQSLRTFAHLDEAEYQLVDVNEGMASALTLLQMQEASGVDVVREFGPVEPLYCSAGRLNQVFMSILKNSCEAIDGDGGRVVINTCDEGSDLCVTVTDNGRGIAPQQLERILISISPPPPRRR